MKRFFSLSSLMICVSCATTLSVYCADQKKAVEVSPKDWLQENAAKHCLRAYAAKETEQVPTDRHLTEEFEALKTWEKKSALVDKLRATSRRKSADFQSKETAALAEKYAAALGLGYKASEYSYLNPLSYGWVTRRVFYGSDVPEAAAVPVVAKEEAKEKAEAQASSDKELKEALDILNK